MKTIDPIKSFMRTNNMIFNYILLTQAAFAGIVLTTGKGTTIKTNFEEDVLLIGLPVFAIFSIIASNFIFKKLVSATATKKTLLEKLNVYRTASLVRLALVEGPTLFAIILYLMKSNFLYLLFAAGMIVYFVTLKPTAKKIIESVNLTYEEKTQFESQVGH